MKEAKNVTGVLIQKYYPYLILLFVAVAGYWQVSFFQHPLKWDAIDQAFPWKYFIGECLQNHTLPLWNPYQHCGYPIYADPQSSAWYPIVWILGFFLGYDIYTFSVDFTLHIFLAGSGMYFLGTIVGYRKQIALLMGIGYMLSGFFTGNAQHIMWIISATWLPFVIGSYIRLLQNRKIKDAAVFSLFMFMLITGGYPAFTLILLYFLLILLTWVTVKMVIKKDWISILSLMKLNALALLLTVLNGSVMLLSIYKIFPYMLRSHGVDLAAALSFPLSPKSLISFVIPFGAVNHDMSSFGTDLTMTNAYFGLILFVFFVLALFIKKTPLIRIFLIWGFIMLLASVGKYLPVRELFYKYLPFFNLFRFPSMLRVFIIISFIVVAGYALEQVLKKRQELSHKLNLSIALVFLIFIVIIAYNTYGKYLDLGWFITKGGVFSFSSTSTLAQQIFFQGLIQLILLSIITITFRKFKKTSGIIIVIIALAVIDMVVAVQLNAPYSVYSGQFDQKSIKAFTDKLPEGFPVADTQPVSKHFDDPKLASGPVWRNLNIFYKKPAFDGSNPFYLKSFQILLDSFPGLLQSTVKNPEVCFASNIKPEKLIRQTNSQENYKTGTFFLPESDYLNLDPVIQNQSNARYPNH